MGAFETQTTVLQEDDLERLAGGAAIVGQRATEENLDALFGSGEEGEGDWSERALCAQTDPEAFFPEKGGKTTDPKSVCARCMVRAECLEYALENDERFGVWGGLSERERRKLKKNNVVSPGHADPSSV